jgi:hypothetical protein
MKRFVLDHLSKACQTAEQITNCRFDAETADATIDLNSGKTVAVYVINRAIRIPEILDTCQTNTARRLHTLYIIDGRMIPADDSDVEPPHWMIALHALARGRIYAYWCDRRRCTIRPIHMEWRWGSEPRHFAHGPAVDVGRLRADRIELAGKYITGKFAVADFGEGTFWKKHDPNAGREHKYSWREWSFGGQQKRRQEAPQGESESWDPWEAFRQNYGEPAGADFAWNSNRRYRQGQAEQDRQRRQRQQRQQYGGRRRTSSYNSDTRSYTVLGVPTTASIDEIKQAYRRMAREYHPDLHPDQKEHYTAKMADINAAFDALRKKLE